jgi:hypothetical protein
MYQNKFLDDFILNRQREMVSASANDKVDKKGRTKSRHGTKTGKNELSGDDAFSMLCSEMPGKTRVIEYFRDRVAELVAEDMAK